MKRSTTRFAGLQHLYAEPTKILACFLFIDAINSWKLESIEQRPDLRQQFTEILAYVREQAGERWPEFYRTGITQISAHYALKPAELAADLHEKYGVA